jgi:hypothetical protein
VAGGAGNQAAGRIEERTGGGGMKMRKKLKKIMVAQQKPIFLSHSYHDKALAEKLVTLLTNGCDVSRNAILCTSLPGMDIKVGENISKNSLKSRSSSSC